METYTGRARCEREAEEETEICAEESFHA